MSWSVLSRMGNFGGKICRENQNTFYIHERFPDSLALYETIKKF
jgi:hypothetical protein